MLFSNDKELRRRFSQLAFINILSNVSVPLLGLVDTAMLGHLDSIRFLAGVALGAVLFDYVFWSFGFLRMGTTGLTAQAVGAEDTEQSFFVLHRAWVLAIGLGLLLWMLAFPIQWFGFKVLSGTPEVVAAGKAYFMGRIIGAPFTLMNFALIGWFLGKEQPRQVLIMTIVATVANTLLNALLILGLGWNAFGAGLSTALSQCIMFVTGIIFYRRHSDRPSFAWRIRLKDPGWSSLMVLNGDILIRTLCLVSAFAVFTNHSARLGTLYLASNALLLRLLTFASYLIDGAAFSTETLAGQFAGAGKTDRLRFLLKGSLLAILGFAAVTLLSFWVAPRLLFRLLTSHTEVALQALADLQWMTPVLLFGSLAYMLDGFFLGLTEGKTLRISMAISFGIVFLPLSYFALWRESNTWLWGAMVAFMLARAITLGLAARQRLAVA